MVFPLAWFTTGYEKVSGLEADALPPTVRAAFPVVSVNTPFPEVEIVFPLLSTSAAVDPVFAVCMLMGAVITAPDLVLTVRLLVLSVYPDPSMDAPFPVWDGDPPVSGQPELVR